MTDITKLARERLEKIKSWRETYGAGSNVMLPAEEAEALPRMALAAMDRDQVRREHAEWSQATFGNVGPVGPLKHLSKEALEAAAEPGDLSEWADMQFLMWDAQRRAGITDEQITQAMIEKLAVNKQRSWPEPKDGDVAVLPLYRHAQAAPVVPDEKDKTVDADDHPLLWSFNEGWNACRAAMLKAQPQNAPQNIPEIIPDGWIPVSEHLPKEKGVYQVWNGKYVDNVPFWFGSFQSLHSELITHWMPLPAAPQEVKP
ncbi:DUF550 domain-containing protein [Klebsiella pneumoniae]|uniref:dATP/dGTP pyrophosphohydrolase domain-containing protein n=2 Tax=Klebsiella pneumoniae TaxID=573 RepID=UPI000A3D7A99|nr:hypothetical protein B8O09_01325 [Klebsiella pneumoniae]UMD21254.1 DUF550 domain-containing protein [Klebsiella pneumoniae]HBU3903991.1 DUF550 domain-containing protein [Klebsiella pneumoniae]